MTKRLAVFGCLALLAAAPLAHGQRAVARPLELGIDAGLTVGLDDPRVTVVSLPAQSFRAGWFISDKLSIEPKFSFNSVSGGGASFTTYALEVGSLYHHGGYRAGSGLYARPFAGIAGIGGDAGSDSNGYLGGGIGAKIPFANRRLATRVEGNLAHVFGATGGTGLGILFGLSFFTR